MMAEIEKRAKEVIQKPFAFDSPEKDKHIARPERVFFAHEIYETERLALGEKEVISELNAARKRGEVSLVRVHGGWGWKLK
jgi:hypothetical protein